MELAADTVVFFLKPHGRAEAGEDGGGGWLGAGEHELERVENAQGDAVEGIGAGGVDDGGEVAAEHVGLANRGDRAGGDGGDGFLDEAFLEAEAEVAGDDFEQVFRLDGREAAEGGGEELDLRQRAAGGGEVGEKGGDVGEGGEGGRCGCNC